jgi:hypothetical protein
MNEAPKTYSISVRLQRTTTEELYLSVPGDEAIMQDEPAAGGSNRIDPGKLVAEAIRLAEQSTDWTIEDQQVAPYPIQKAPSRILSTVHICGRGLVPKYAYALIESGHDGVGIAARRVRIRRARARSPGSSRGGYG